MSLIECNSCGGANFRLNEEAPQFCEICGVLFSVPQAKEYGYDTIDQGSSKVGVLANDDSNVGWSSFEAFNTILHHWCQLLVKLGLPTSIYEGVFAVWFKYLDECKIFSDDDQQNIHHNRDLIFFGRKKKKKKQCDIDAVVDKANSSRSGANLSYLSKHISKSLANSSMMSDDEVDTIVEAPPDDGEKNSAKIAQPGEEKHSHSLVYFNGSLARKNFFIDLTIEKLLGIFYLGVRMADVNVFSFDIIRWCRQGYLPYFNVTELLKNKKLNVYDVHTLQQPLICTEHLRCYSGLFAAFISAPIVPLPQYNQVWIRLVQELRLPDETTSLCLMLLNKTGVSHVANLFLPDIEVTAACFIILALKICFGLDDFHEVHLSEFAHKVDKETIHLTEEIRLFSFTRWQRFIDKTFWWRRQVDPYNMTENCYSYESSKLKSHFYSAGSSHCTNLKTRAWTKLMSTKLNDLTAYPTTNEEYCHDEIIFSPFNSTTGLFSQYIASKTENSSSERLRKVAEELDSISFKGNILNWILRSDYIERVLSKNVKHKIVLCSRAFNEMNEKIQSNLAGYSEKEIQITLPDPKLSYWKTNEPRLVQEENEKELPRNFCWLINLTARLCETSRQKILKRFHTLERMYCNHAQIT